ncbi:uncharacterized protein LOC127565978 [Drosophila albomicans]|uniref:Uncharacterized protein LOC127565978 n=1 Tax=Drosophila albomicans TaxID=7291 RepID=A0A9C6T821_DROAB|nr:uncharacterized protein LOC127565978 [Drosophila albomicans]
MSTPKSSMKTRNYESKLSNAVNFVHHARVNVADRDYGLMQVTAQAGTPHPRILTAINIDTLKERLEEEHDKHLKGKKSINQESVVAKHFKPEGSRLFSKNREGHIVPSEHRDVGALFKKKAKEPRSRSWNAADATSLRSSKTISEKSKTKENPKFVRIAGRNSDSSSSSSNSVSSTQYLSFNERRRLFHEGEFTIAKNGKKMSDNLMPQYEEHSWSPNEHIDSEAEQARAAIEVFIKKHGFVMAPTGTLTNLRRISSNLSKRTISEHASMKSIHSGNTKIA